MSYDHLRTLNVLIIIEGVITRWKPFATSHYLTIPPGRIFASSISFQVLEKIKSDIIFAKSKYPTTYHMKHSLTAGGNLRSDASLYVMSRGLRLQKAYITLYFIYGWGTKHECCGPMRFALISPTTWRRANRLSLCERSISVRVVDIWLGEEGDGSQVLLEFVPILDRAQEMYNVMGDHRSILEMPTKDREKYGIPSTFDLRYWALFKVATRPWFERVWIIQEVSVASSAVIYCGEWTFPWTTFIEAIEWAAELGLTTIYNVDDRNNERVLRWMQAKVALGVPQKLLTLLLRHRQASATDQRDKIFALLGLACDSDVVEVDYRKSVEEVYREFTVNILNDGQDLDILGAAHLHVGDGLTKLPSWTPDWSVGNSIIISLHCEHWNGNLLLPSSASGSSISHPQFKENNSILGITGHLFDEIVAVGPAMVLGNPVGANPQDGSIYENWSRSTETWGILSEWENICDARSAKRYVTGENILDAYWKTLCVGIFPEGDFEAGKRAFTSWYNQRRYTKAGWVEPELPQMAIQSPVPRHGSGCFCA
ncbi:hypothetical protein K432DRAFT_445801 [Lepidopterella palustris CBS 459.81]|uniref:Heterokaryon incompatibility domain-containing protein n=1 Tax=Lepidopterella palustris CBS 459.81 TaxID=1314670 RepID=A0A8E2JBW5_9PEZI|nr:hypothetical protein K432DRAFT_445801 [Lepidopterella palustris CBS 459.81]